ncbi:MAG: hypothetical protein J5965_09345 [Aeriscardovia sp.]|nr:hypothetical protein [Aeriscardovia sp.]
MTAGRHVNSLSQSWCTPHKYVNAIKRFWNGKIGLDPCSNEYSVVEAETEYSLPEHDGLKENWDFPTVYVNPPYGADRDRGTTIKDWLAKCANTHREYGSEVIALVPVAPNTSHWKKCVFGVADAICFLYDIRLRFLEKGYDTGKGAPMACCMIYWGSDIEGFQNNFMQYGAVVDISNLKEIPIGEDVLVPALEFA